MPMNREQFLEYAQAIVIAGAKRSLEEWGKRFEEEPFHAFAWSGKAIVAAAELAVFTRAIEALANEDSQATVESLRVYGLEQILRFAQSPSARPHEMAEVVAWTKLVAVL